MGFPRMDFSRTGFSRTLERRDISVRVARFGRPIRVNPHDMKPDWILELARSGLVVEENDLQVQIGSSRRSRRARDDAAGAARRQGCAAQGYAAVNAALTISAAASCLAAACSRRYFVTTSVICSALTFCGMQIGRTVLPGAGIPVSPP